MASDNGPGTRRRGRPSGGIARAALAGAFIGVALWAGAGSAAASRPQHATANDPYGAFVLSGAISGTLVATAATCAASKSAPDVQFSWYGTAHLHAISKQSIVTMELDLGGSRYGRSGTLKNSNGNPPFLTFGATGTSYSFQSSGGTYSTSSKGTNGSLDVKLENTSGAGRLTIRGAWHKCQAAAGT
jgi:hypothetical protein